MKKIIAFLLVAMMIATCMVTMVSAAGGSANANISSSQTVKPGATVTLTVTVSGEYSNYEMDVSADAGLTITGITGVTNYGGYVCYSSGVNVSSSSFTVTVKVADDAKPGSYKVYASPTYGSMIVPADQDTEDGVVDGRVRVSLGSDACTLTIEEPKCEHKLDGGVVTKEPNCTDDGLKVYTCELCGEVVKEEILPALGHKIDCSATAWTSMGEDGHFHDHICSVCGVKVGDTHTQAHTMVPYDEKDLGNGYIRYYRACAYCAYTDTQDVPYGTHPTGDITSVLSAGTAAIFVTMMSIVGLVVKRKAI